MFSDRASAGRVLAAHLPAYAGRDDVIVLGLPRGGVVVAAEVADALPAPLDICVVRKLGVPGREELAFGAIASGGALVLNSEVVQAFQLTDDDIHGVVRRERVELERRERVYRGHGTPQSLPGRTVVLVDDGLATGATMRAAVEAVRQTAPAHIVVAVPVAAAQTVAALEQIADQVVSADTPRSFMAVGQWYVDFRQTTDDEVRDLLALRR